MYPPAKRVQASIRQRFCILLTV